LAFELTFKLGDVELIVGLEQNPQYKTVIIGAINLMRHVSFEWINPDDSAEDIGIRCLNLHIENKHQLSYAIRFSTTKPKNITLGVFFSFYDGENYEWKSKYHFRRYQILDNCMFKCENNSAQYSFSHLLKLEIDYINQKMISNIGANNFIPFEYYQMKPLHLNTCPLVMEKLDFYITEHHLLMNGYVVMLQHEDESNSDESGESGELVAHKFKQGTKSWSYSKE
jgi:hypothetical protein